MSNFIWDESYSVGVSEMDGEHQKLIGIMNDLHELANQKAPAAEIEATLNDLVDYTELHFADEEEYMASIGYKKLANHQRIHRDLLHKLHSFAGDFARTHTLDESFFVFLKIWLSAHIKGIDFQYAALTNESAS